MEFFRSTHEQVNSSRWILLTAFVCTLMACATALLLRPTIARNARSPVLALISSIIYVGLVLVIAAGAAEMQIRYFHKRSPGAKCLLLLTLLAVFRGWRP
jgi:hypothetical protein